MRKAKQKFDFHETFSLIVDYTFSIKFPSVEGNYFKLLQFLLERLDVLHQTPTFLSAIKWKRLEAFPAAVSLCQAKGKKLSFGNRDFGMC